jgi:hypothetical protein
MLLDQLLLCAGTSVDTSTVQRVSAPTRDIYVERTKDGDRVFAGFGRPSQEYCDCFLDPAELPEDIIKVRQGSRRLQLPKLGPRGSGGPLAGAVVVTLALWAGGCVGAPIHPSAPRKSSNESKQGWMRTPATLVAATLACFHCMMFREQMLWRSCGARPVLYRTRPLSQQQTWYSRMTATYFRMLPASAPRLLRMSAFFLSCTGS